jgi:Fe-S-cluster containining protein
VTTEATTLADLLPEGLRPFLADPLRRPKAAERKSTCDRCAMCAPAGADPGAFRSYHPDAKCCTYHPALPNFLVGALLADADPALAEGRRRVRAKIEQGVGVDPAGIDAPAPVRRLYPHSAPAFGRSTALLCPYFDRDRRNCTIWRYREAVCSTFFCKLEEGKDGADLWSAVKRYLLEIEDALVEHVLLELGFDGGARRRMRPRDAALDADDLDGRAPSPQAARERWGPWHGRETELFLRAHEITRALTPADVAALLGVRGRACVDEIGRALDALEPDRVPDPLRLAPRLHLTVDGDSHVMLVTYSANDPLRLRRALFDELRAFDGRRSNAEALDAIAERSGMRLARGLVTALHRTRILVAAGSEPSAP